MSVPFKEQYNSFRGLIRPIDGGYSTAIVPVVTEHAMKILQINASARREGAYVTRPGNQIVSGLRALDPSAVVTVRDLAVSTPPVLDEAAPGSLFAPAA
jgi:hypothetical protein